MTELNITVIGWGNWGTTASRILSKNVAKNPEFVDKISIWGIEEEIKIDDKVYDLSIYINKFKKNIKYLPNYELSKNIFATSDIKLAVENADFMVFVIPHEYLEQTCENIKKYIKPSCKGISLIKGCYVNNGKPRTCSDVIQEILNISCCSLSGANVANCIANEELSETTIGYINPEEALIWHGLFSTSYFKVTCIPDVKGVELCGGLKNIIAIVIGFCKGINLGTNTMAAIMRLGMQELKKFCFHFYDTILHETFNESCGIADLITTCWGGRNVKCAEIFIKEKQKLTWEEIEKKELNGQKLQGPSTCKEIYEILVFNKIEEDFPLFNMTYKIAFEKQPPEIICTNFLKLGDLRNIIYRDECSP